MHIDMNEYTCIFCKDTFAYVDIFIDTNLYIYIFVEFVWSWSTPFSVGIDPVSSGPWRSRGGGGGGSSR